MSFRQEFEKIAVNKKVVKKVGAKVGQFGMMVGAGLTSQKLYHRAHEKTAAGMPGAAKGVSLGSGFAKAPGVAKHMTSGIKPPVVQGLRTGNIGTKMTGGVASLNRPLVGQQGAS